MLYSMEFILGICMYRYNFNSGSSRKLNLPMRISLFDLDTKLPYTRYYRLYIFIRHERLSSKGPTYIYGLHYIYKLFLYIYIYLCFVKIYEEKEVIAIKKASVVTIDFIYVDTKHFYIDLTQLFSYSIPGNKFRFSWS